MAGRVVGYGVELCIGDDGSMIELERLLAVLLGSASEVGLLARCIALNLFRCTS